MWSTAEIMESITGEKQKITIPRWFDRHLHLRDGEMMKTVLPCTLDQLATGAVIMTNLFKADGTSDPVDSIEKAVAYRDRIMAIISDRDFVPCIAFYLTDHSQPGAVVMAVRTQVCRVVKLYMANQEGQGGTTGSGHGVRNLRGRYPVFAEMEKYKVPLCGHFEAVEENTDEFDREIRSLERDLVPILKVFPELPVIFEHITDGRAADFIAEYNHPGGLYATVTVQHMEINRNAMFWGGMNPINYCKPVPKREEHRKKIRQYVTSGNRRFGAGTDSAPHDESAKSRCCGCAAGIFTADSAVERYTKIFDEDGALEHLGPFMSENFLHIYGMEPSKEMMTIERKPQLIREHVGGVRVFNGGQKLPFTLMK